MVDTKSVEKQLKKIKFDGGMWNRAEIHELPHILHEGETISECANGIYEGGFALLIATDMRVLLIDKKPLNYLTVEDMRFDMINELDYSHRLMGATITISAGSKTFKFKSYNQPRLRKLIGHVQDRMSQIKREQAEKEQTQQQHLEEINKQLQMYLLAQHNQLLQQQIKEGHDAAIHESLQPPLGLRDYLFAQRLLEQVPEEVRQKAQPASAAVASPPAPARNTDKGSTDSDNDDLLAVGQKEIFGNPANLRPAPPATGGLSAATATVSSAAGAAANAAAKALEINPLRIAYSKLPMALRNRRFGRPSFHAHSQATAPSQTQPAA